MNCSNAFNSPELYFDIAFDWSALKVATLEAMLAKNWSVWFCDVALNWLEALVAAWSENKLCTRLWALNISACWLLFKLVISICIKDWAFCTAACCLLFKLDISKLANADASAITIACLLPKLFKFIVFAARLFSNAIFCSAVKFILAISPILEAFCTLDWKAWSNSCPINVARCCAESIARCCLLDKFCVSNCPYIWASACAIGSADSNAPWTIAWPAILEAPKPLAAICACIPRSAPAAHAGGLFASKLAVNPASCPCTVACVEGVAVAASICSAKVEAAWALAAPVINSPVCICLCTGFCITLATPWAACNWDTELAACCCAFNCACWLTAPWAPCIGATVEATFKLDKAVSIWAASVGVCVGAAVAVPIVAVWTDAPVGDNWPVFGFTIWAWFMGVSAATVAPPWGKVGFNACWTLKSSMFVSVAILGPVGCCVCIGTPCSNIGLWPEGLGACGSCPTLNNELLSEGVLGIFAYSSLDTPTAPGGIAWRVRLSYANLPPLGSLK